MSLGGDKTTTKILNNHMLGEKPDECQQGTKKILRALANFLLGA
jgi:hypothetical protein